MNHITVNNHIDEGENLRNLGRHLVEQIKGQISAVTVRTITDGHDESFGDILKGALVSAFEAHPTMTHCVSDSYSRCWENRDGVPTAVTITTLRLQKINPTSEAGA